MKHDDAIRDNTRALDGLAGALRPIDGNGFTPDEDPPAVESFDEQFARTRESFASAQEDLVNNVVQIVYELGRLRGIVEERNRQEAAR